MKFCDNPKCPLHIEFEENIYIEENVKGLFFNRKNRNVGRFYFKMINKSFCEICREAIITFSDNLDK